MSFMDMIKRDNNATAGAFDELGTEMAEAFDESMAAEDADEKKADPAPPQGTAAPASAAASDMAAPKSAPAATKSEASSKPTAHTQSRLAALASFDKLYDDMQARLQEIEEKLSEVTTSQQLTRRFFGVIQADIHRANELESSNLKLAGGHKKLTEQLGETSRKLQERQNLVEGLRQRESHLAQDNETLRAALSAAKLELVESANLHARNEAKLGEAVKALSVQTVEAQRCARENEVLREKQMSLSIEIDKTLKREAEARRKLDELTTLHANEAAQHAELVAAFGKSEKEALRLQMAFESTQLKQAEMAEAAMIVETDRQAETERNAAEMRGLRSEIQALQSRLDTAVAERSEATGELAELKAQFNDALNEKHVADERLAALMKENEAVQQTLSAASANISQLALQQETEQIKLDIHRQECEDLRAEIATLNTRIKDLLPFERLYKVTKARERENGHAAALDLVPAAVTKPRNHGRRAVSHNRSTAA